MKWIACQDCRFLVKYSDEDVSNEGYPHIRCPFCESWIPLFF
jgi:hypothetical protein